MTVKANRPGAGNAGTAAETTTNDRYHRTPETRSSQAPKLKTAVEHALRLMRCGTHPPLANVLAAREFRLDVTQVARATGAIAADARLNRKARREAQGRQL